MEQQAAEQALSIPASLWGILAVNALAVIGLLAKAILELAQQRKNGGALMKGNPHNLNGVSGVSTRAHRAEPKRCGDDDSGEMCRATVDGPDH